MEWGEEEVVVVVEAVAGQVKTVMSTRHPSEYPVLQETGIDARLKEADLQVLTLV